MSNQKRLRPSGERRARLRHPAEPNMMGLLASESREITKHPPGETLLERPSCHVSPGETICSPACLQTHGRNRCNMGPGRGPGAPTIEQKSVPGPSWDNPWRHREGRKHLWSVPEASWGIPGVPRQRPGGSPSDPGTPKRTPGGAQERAEASKIDAKWRRGAKKTCLFHATRSRSIVGAISCRFWSIFGVFAKSANPLKHRKLRCFVRVG